MYIPDACRRRAFERILAGEGGQPVHFCTTRRGVTLTPFMAGLPEHPDSPRVIPDVVRRGEVASPLPHVWQGDGDAVTQRSIEMVVGRLVTDEEFRATFLRDPHGALAQLLERGTHLTHAEIAALIAMDAEFWDRVADEIDPRLQKANLKS